jgi:hypothetical protein
MAPTIRKFRKLPVTVDAGQYDGTAKNRSTIINWITRHRGVAFSAAELMWRPDMGCYYHQKYGFVYLPQGARSAGSPLSRLGDDELIVRTNYKTFALVFPGDYVVRSRSGFYPLSEESFARSHVSNISRRGTIPAEQLPAV